MDVFSAHADEPARIDFWGDEVDDIRAFGIGDQRSRQALDRLEVYPAREFRPDEAVAERAHSLLKSDPWNASVWDRLAEGAHFAGMESWLPWMAAERSVLDEVGESVMVILSRFHPKGQYPPIQTRRYLHG